MKRRDFLTLLMGATGSSSALFCGKEKPVLISCAPPADLSVTNELLSAGAKTTVTKNPLQLIGSVTLPSSPTVQNLVCKSASVPIGGGKSATAWTYDGLFPAKTLVANNGQTVKLNISNNLAESTTTHWHGLLVSPDNDGGPGRLIASGSSLTNTFTLNQRASLNWYHPHPHMNTGKQVNLGMAGLFIIRDAEEAGLNLPSGNYEIPLVIRDATLDKNGNLSYKATSSGFVGQFPMVNGTQSPYTTVKPTWYRFRLLNSANARVFRLALYNGTVSKSMFLIGNDGGLLDKSYEQTSIDFAPAERLDLLINFSGLRNTKLSLKDDLSGWELLEFRVEDIADIAASVPSTLTTITALTSSPSTTVRTFSFDGMTMINGKVYDMNRVDWQVPLNTTEKWVFRTSGNGPHPVHVHGASFQVISRTGGRAKLFDWERGWKDTVLLQDGETIEVLIRFSAGYKGIYLLHCHKLEHEDAGMMANFEVI